MEWGKDVINSPINKISDMRYEEEADHVDKKTPPISLSWAFLSLQIFCGFGKRWMYIFNYTEPKFWEEILLLQL
jgi:hypothetical protein